jgi:TPR repeat protein
VKPNLPEAIRLYRSAANAGDVNAQLTLGTILLRNKGSASEAVRWLTLAANKRDKYALHSLGRLYLTGQFVSQDTGRAIQLLRSAAAEGNGYAELDLANYYLRSSNFQDALTWARRAKVSLGKTRDARYAREIEASATDQLKRKPRE